MPYFDRTPTVLGLKRLISIMGRSYFRISVLTLIAAGIAVLYLNTSPPIYKATAVLQVPDMHLQTQAEILRSDRISNNVITALNLNPETETAAVRHHHFVTEFKGRLSVSPVKDTHLIRVSYAHQQPEMAATIANTYATEYIKLNREFQNQQINILRHQNGTQWLNDRISRLRDKISHLEQKISDFLQQEHLGEDTAATSKMLHRLTNELQATTELYNQSIQQQDEAVQNEKPILPAILTELASPPVNAEVLYRPGLFIIIILLAITLILLHVFLRSRYLVDQKNLSRLETPLLGTLPDIKSAEKNFNRLSPQEIYSSNRLINDAAQSLGIALEFNSSGQNKQVTVITSVSAGEGKSTSAIYLAMSLASNKKVILIEADMRKPTIGQKLGIPQNHSGLANLLLNGGRLTDCIWQDDQSGLAIMPAGTIPQSPLYLLTSERFKSCLTILKSHYDHIIVDSPPSKPVSDTLVIGQLSDFNIVIARSNYSKKTALIETIEMLSKHNINVDGIILNQIALQDDKHYQYQYSKEAC